MTYTPLTEISTGALRLSPTPRDNQSPSELSVKLFDEAKNCLPEKLQRLMAEDRVVCYAPEPTTPGQDSRLYASGIFEIATSSNPEKDTWIAQEGPKILTDARKRFIELYGQGLSGNAVVDRLNEYVIRESKYHVKCVTVGAPILAGEVANHFGFSRSKYYPWFLEQMKKWNAAEFQSASDTASLENVLLSPYQVYFCPEGVPMPLRGSEQTELLVSPEVSRIVKDWEGGKTAGYYSNRLNAMIFSRITPRLVWHESGHWANEYLRRVDRNTHRNLTLAIVDALFKAFRGEGLAGVVPQADLKYAIDNGLANEGLPTLFAAIYGDSRDRAKENEHKLEKADSILWSVYQPAAERLGLVQSPK